MSRLEQYREFLIPVDDVMYVEYRKPNKKGFGDNEREGGTYVWINMGGGASRNIKIGKKNLLEDFQKWHKQFVVVDFSHWVVSSNDNPSTVYWPNPPAVPVPLHDKNTPYCGPCFEYTTSDGKKHFLPLGDETTPSIPHVVEHDGMTHTL